MPKVKLNDVAVECKETIKGETGLPIVGLEHLIPGEVCLTQWSDDSDNTFTKRFRKEYGIPLGRYMDEMLHQQICHLLASTDLSIGQIADALGFCDQFYLTRFFTARQGISPRQYRLALPRQP